jgi:2-polyprenyl-3-methyl-5-hydroxy-6-metoxy-1,4-benzoquinol methylase
MADCCVPRGYDKLFGKRAARHEARRYRRKGLGDNEKRIVDFFRSRGVEGATVLEVGGGVGTLQIELLKAGAGRAVNAELSPYWEKEARELVREAGVEERWDYRVDNIAANGKEVGPADAVIMHRVVCCDPDPDALVGAAAERARRHLVMTFPRERLASRMFVGLINAVARLLHWEHRSYVHPVAQILTAAERGGLRLVQDHRGFIWQFAALERAAAT